MNLTLEKIRQTFINTYQAGYDKEDRKLQNNFIDELIYQARAALIQNDAKYHEQCLQRKVYDITKIAEPNSIYYTTPIETINQTRNGAGIFIVKPISSSKRAEVPFELMTIIKFFQAKYDRITKNKTKVAISGNTMFLRFPPLYADVKQIEVHAIFYNPFAVIDFSESSPFPFSSGNISVLIETMYNIYLQKISQSIDTRNDSAEKIKSLPEVPQRQQQQE